MGRGRAVKSERLPVDPERRAYFVYLNEIRRKHGTKTLKDIAEEMHLKAASRISALLSDHLPVNEDQAKALLTALGGTYGEIQQGLGFLPYSREAARGTGRFETAPGSHAPGKEKPIIRSATQSSAGCLMSSQLNLALIFHKG